MNMIFGNEVVTHKITRVYEPTISTVYKKCVDLPVDCSISYIFSHNNRVNK